VLAIAGDVDTGKLLDAATSSFGDWRGAGEPPVVPAPPVRQRERRVSVVGLPSRQIHVSVGNLSLSRADPLYYAATVLDAILGDSAGFGSRLASRLREELGLAYVVESDATGTAGLEPGVFWAYAATSPANLEPLLRELMSELRATRSEPPSDDELESAAAYLIGRDRIEHETTDAIAGRLVHIERHGLGIDYDARYPDLISAVTRDDVLDAARLVIDAERYSLAMVGPLDPDRASTLP
jgi:zinc protease